MTEQELKEIEVTIKHIEDRNMFAKHLDMAIKALKRQISKKPEEIYKAVCCEDIEAYGEDALFGYCPECNLLQCSVWNPEHCGDCGQKLGWKE